MMFFWFSNSDSCLTLPDDSSGYWSNITDNNNGTCVDIPRPDKTDLFQKLHINVTCVNNIISGSTSVLDLHVAMILQDTNTCPDESILFYSQNSGTNTCSGQHLKRCQRTYQDSLSNNCAFLCKCSTEEDICVLLLTQQHYKPFQNLQLSVCKIHIQVLEE